MELQRYSPGGAGNVAANLSALGVGTVTVIGMVGDDLFGAELRRQLTQAGLAGDNLMPAPAGWRTLVYAKPYRQGQEMERFDFGGGHTLQMADVALLLKRVEQSATTSDVVVINQQVPGFWNAELVDAVNAIVARHPTVRFIVDSRDLSDRFVGCALKVNLTEATRMLGEDGAAVGRDDALRLVALLAKRCGQPVFLTRGADGLVAAMNGIVVDVPGIELGGAVDAVGAGDAALAAVAAALAAKGSVLEAATFANLVAAITTRKIRTTGTASPEELRRIGPAPDYVYTPRLAAQSRLRRVLPDTEIETVTGRVPEGRIRHAIFDHDGTISVLRQGWEAVMEPMMVRAVLGSRLETIDDVTHARILAAVRELIDRTTGIQTLAQMTALIALVRAEGFVPAADVLDEHGYKAIYNEALLAMVRDRRRQLDRGELASEDWQIKNARPLLERLRARGVVLYLASGTDVDDVRDEAKALGYADLFDGGIFGAVGSLDAEAKRDVLKRILTSSGVEPAELMVVGDGPVEMREGRRRGAYTVGVASDEVRRHGIDWRKRTRLIRAGSDLIVPDFSQLDALLHHLNLA